MLYNLSSAIDRSRAERRFIQLCKEQVVIELRKKAKRSLNQNRYLHLILGWFGMELGYTLSEVKQIYKEQNSLIYFYEKNGKMFIRSSADLDTGEMTKSIEKFRNYSSMEAKVYLPEPREKLFLEEIEIELSKNNYI